MVHQQKIERYAIAVVALRAASNRLADTRPLMPALLRVAVPDQVGDSNVSSLSTSQQQLVTTRKLWEGKQMGEANELAEKSATGKVDRRIQMNAVDYILVDQGPLDHDRSICSAASFSVYNPDRPRNSA